MLGGGYVEGVGVCVVGNGDGLTYIGRGLRFFTFSVFIYFIYSILHKTH